jgi:hypothetical protein
MPFINLTKKFVFIGNARTGSTSIYVYLNNVCKNDETIWEDGLNALPNLYHMSVQDTINKYPFCKDFTFFCFVRNPYTRLLSSFIEFTTERGHFPWSSELLKFKNFEDFSLNFNNTEIKNDIHFIPLSEQIKCNEKINLIICRFENLNEEFTKIANIINIPQNINTHWRKTNYEEINYKKYYNMETQTLIGNFYKNDLDLFNYTF